MSARAGWLAAVAVLAMVAVAGCHGMRPPPGSNKAVGAPSKDHEQSLAAAKIIDGLAADPALAAGLPAEIKQNGLRVTTSPGYPPMEMFDDDGTYIIGVDPSLARAIGKVLGVPVTVQKEDFNAQIPGLLTGRYDLVMSSLTDNAERRAKATMVDYVKPGAAFVIRAGNPAGIHTPADVCGRTLAVVDNGSALRFAQKYSTACTDAGRPPATILKFTGDQDAQLQVNSGRADADINDYPVAAYHAAVSNGRLDIVRIAGTEAPFGIAVLPSRPAVVDAVRGALDKLIESGAYLAILRAWGVADMAVPRAGVNGGA